MKCPLKVVEVSFSLKNPFKTQLNAGPSLSNVEIFYFNFVLHDNNKSRPVVESRARGQYIGLVADASVSVCVSADE